MDKEELLRRAKDPRHIPGIYNYCDRWCERCQLTARCLTFAMEEESGTRAEDLDRINDLFWGKISESFQMAFSLLQDLADEEGVDLDAVVDEPQADEPKVVHLLPSMAQRYALLVDELVKNNGDWIEPEPRQSPNHLHIIKDTPLLREDPISQKEALEVILWYQVFLPPKLYRALLSKTEEVELEEDDFQKDSDGSAKVALIGIDRSLSAWGELAAQREGRGSPIGKIVNHLTRLREMVEKEFPGARAFIRPGFDAPERSVFNDQGNSG
jgi:hypothetical protein